MIDSLCFLGQTIKVQGFQSKYSSDTSLVRALVNILDSQLSLSVYIYNDQNQNCAAMALYVTCMEKSWTFKKQDKISIDLAFELAVGLDS